MHQTRQERFELFTPFQEHRWPWLPHTSVRGKEQTSKGRRQKETPKVRYLHLCRKEPAAWGYPILQFGARRGRLASRCDRGNTTFLLQSGSCVRCVFRPWPAVLLFFHFLVTLCVCFAASFQIVVPEDFSRLDCISFSLLLSPPLLLPCCGAGAKYVTV